jgi:hypothetical protein
MQSSFRRFAYVAVAAAVIVVLGPTLFPTAAPAQSAQNDDVTKALIGELRLLRVAIENMAAANSRIQVLSMRAGQQEQRLANVTNQLATVRTSLRSMATDSALHTAEMMQIEERLRLETDPNARRELESHQQQMKAMLNAVRMKEAALQAEVNQLTQQANEEQARLNEIQRRLDDLDRVSGDRR